MLSSTGNYTWHQKDGLMVEGLGFMVLLLQNGRCRILTTVWNFDVYRRSQGANGFPSQGFHDLSLMIYNPS